MGNLTVKSAMNSQKNQMDSELLHSFVRVGITVNDEPRDLYTVGMEQQAMRENLHDKSDGHDCGHICRRKKTKKNPMLIEKKAHKKTKSGPDKEKVAVEYFTFTDRERAIAASFSKEIEMSERIRVKKMLKMDDEPKVLEIKETFPDAKIVSFKDFLPAPAHVTHLQRSQVKIEKRKRIVDNAHYSDHYTDLDRAAAVSFGDYFDEMESIFCPVLRACLHC